MDVPVEGVIFFSHSTWFDASVWLRSIILIDVASLDSSNGLDTNGVCI